MKPISLAHETSAHDRMAYLLAVLLLACSFPNIAGAQDAQPISAATMPFSASVTTRPLHLDILSFYVDSPLRQAVIDGNVWVFGALPDPYHNPISVPRWKGPDFEHMVRQPDGAADFPQRTASSFINSGLWYDQATGTIYALMHGEYGHGWPGDAWCRKKTWLVTSHDLGLHWTFVGDVLTPAYPTPLDRMEYSGSQYEMGPADYDLYVDTRGGYFYVTSWNGFVAKNGILNHFTAGTVEVARCAIKDKMAPGKWHKFNHGSWTEPGLRGKASRVGMATYGIYGNTIYSTYLQKYLRIGVNAGVGDPRFPNLGMRDNSVYISTCTDLSRQDWTPMAKLLDQPGNPMSGFTLTAEDGIDPSVAGQTFHAYNYWEKSGRILDITLHKGELKAAPFPPYGSYSYEAHPESGDRIESRRTKIVAAASPEMHYSGEGWSVENNPAYYAGQIRKCEVPGCSVEFSFRGSAIYWRAIAAQDGGKADVYIDNQLQTTVDLYFWDSPLIFQFAFIKTGLAPGVTHTIKVVARSDKNANSRGTSINHMGFEYAAESYWASAGFSSISGKNSWHYQSRRGTAFNDLKFNAASNCWLKDDQCMVGNDHELPLATDDAVRKWVAPHNGNIRMEGAPAISQGSADAVVVSVLKNPKELWSHRLAAQRDQSSSHDLTIPVSKGDEISFIVHREGVAAGAGNNEPATDNPANAPRVASLTIGPQEYTCGMVCHSVSRLVVPLPGPGKTFSAKIGVDFDAGHDAESKKSAVFSVIVGGKTSFKSDPLKGNAEGAPIHVDLGGAHELVLEVSDGKDGIGFDWAKWVDAKVILADGKQIWLAGLPLNESSRPHSQVVWDPVITYVDATTARK